MTRIAYLTIDDGPSKDMKKKVDFLVSKNIPAIWFCRGDFLEKRPRAAIYAIKKGHIIGNHSYNHPRFSNLTLKQCYEEIKKTDEIIDNLYKKAGVKRPTKFFRFSYGDGGKGKWGKKDLAIQAFLKKLDYIQPRFEDINTKYIKAGFHKALDILWTYDPGEWEVYKETPIKRKKIIFKKIIKDINVNFSKKINYNANEIILIHDHVEKTEMFIRIMEEFLITGIKFELPKF